MNPYMQFMNPFPHQGNQMQNHSYPHPSYEAIPPQFRGHPEGYQYHPFYHPGMNGFAYPSQCYGCCNHNFLPSCCPPPSMPYGHHHPTHCCGGYSVPPPGAQHPCHFSPLLHTMGPTQYEYQKDHSKYQHSFDCPNNTQKVGNSLKIEEASTEPRGDTSAVPSDFKNSPYPIVFVPPKYIKDNSGGKAIESTYDRQEVSPYNRNEHQPLFLNKWLPVDIDKWKSSEQVDDDSGRKIHEDNESPHDVSSNFPVPIFYVPYKANDLGTTEQKNVAQQCPQGVSVVQMADCPSSPIHMDSSKDKSKERIVISKVPRIMENSDGKKNAQMNEAASGTSSKNVGNEAKKASGDGNKKLSSPTKSSKLPPVCLRVDPLPKKKKDCSPSKHSSPHVEKDKSGDSFKEDTKPKASPLPDETKISQNDMLVSNKPDEQGVSNEQPKRIVKTIKVHDAEIQPGEDVLVSNINCINANEGRSDLPLKVEDQPNHTQAEKKEAAKFNRSIKPELSEDEAAKKIQSTYRGYEERKWKPLESLKNIKTVQDEVTRLKKQIEALEGTQDNTLLDKSRTVIGETIMNLLLKLDSIQGLPPNVRQVRKFVARDLTSLQEQLDALGRRQAEKTIMSEDDQGKKQLVLESGNEIDKKDKNKNQEEPPLIELSMDEGNEVHKEDVPDVVDRYTIQLNDNLHYGSETLKDESSLKDVSSTTGNLVSESSPARLVEDEVKCVPNVGPAELQEQVPLVPDEQASISKITNLIEVGDVNRLETVDEASGEDTSDLKKESFNVEPVSKVHVTEHVQDFGKVDDTEQVSLTESTTQVQDLSLANNEKLYGVEPESIVQSTAQVQDLSLADNEKPDEALPEFLVESTAQVQDLSLANNEKVDEAVPEFVVETTAQVQDISLANNENVDEAVPAFVLESAAQVQDLSLANEEVDDAVPESVVESTTQVQDLSLENNEKADDAVHDSVVVSTTQVQDLSLANNEKVDDAVHESVAESTTIVHDLSLANNEKVDDVMHESVVESTTQVQDLSLANNEKVDDAVHEYVAESTTQVCEGVQDDVMENSGRVQHHYENIEPGENPHVQCEEPAIVEDEDYDAPANLTTLPHGQKQADVSLEIYGHPCEPAMSSNLKETSEGKFSLPSTQSVFAGTDISLIEENKRLREQLQKIIEAGQEQLSAISGLSKKVRDLERKLHRKKKVKVCHNRAGSRSSF